MITTLILDWWGRRDIGIRDGRICAIGKAGNPDINDGVTFDWPGTSLRESHPTAGGIDTTSTSSAATGRDGDRRGITMLGWHRSGNGTNATTCTPAFHISRMLQAAEGLPVNWASSAKAMPAPRSARRAGARRRCGLKLHEDWGTTPAAPTAASTWRTALTCRFASAPTP